MANQYAKGNAQVLIWLSDAMKRDLYSAREKLNRENPGAQYSANSVVRSLVENFIREGRL